MPDWESRRIEELVSLVSSGGTPRARDSRYYSDSGTPFLKIDDVTKSRGRFVDTAEQSITRLALEESAAKVFPAGTVLVTMYGTMGVTKTLSVPMATNQAIAALVPPFRCDPDYLALALSFRRTDLERLAAQTTQPNISGTIIRRFRLPVPPLEEQRRIVEILDTADETIQATERIIAKLDTISTALDEASLSRLGTGDLVRLGEECRVLGGKRLPAGHSYSPTPTQYRYLRVVDFYKRNVDYQSLAALSESTFEALSRYEIRSGELFISIAGSIGHVGVNQPPKGMTTILTENAARIVPSGSLVPGFLALQMNSPAVKEQVRAEIGTGGGVPKLALHRVANIRISCPEISIQKEVAQLHEVGRETRDAETRKLDKLRKLRAGLAADLLSGRVRTMTA